MSRRKQARPIRATLEEDPLHGSRNNPLTTNDEQQQQKQQQEPSTPQDDNDTGSENEDMGVQDVTVDEAVDLTSNRSSHHDEDIEDIDETNREETNEELPMEEDEEDNDSSNNDDIVDNNDDIDDETTLNKQLKNRQDAENNNNNNNNNSSNNNNANSIFPPAAGCTSHVTLEALQNTKVAVAQFAATALAGVADPAALQLLQSSLYTLQHQQVFQLQLISQLQQQLSITQGQTPGQPGEQLPGGNEIAAKDNSGRASLVTSPCPPLHPKSSPLPLSLPALSAETLPNAPAAATAAAVAAVAARLQQLSNLITSSTSSTTSTSPVTVISAPSFTSQQQQQQENNLSPITLALPATSSSTSIITPSISSPLTASSSSSSADAPSTQINNNNNNNSNNTTTVTSTNTSTNLPLTHPSLSSISSSLASTIITNNDPLPLNEPNTLEMLQKRAQEVLDNASQGLLANNLADELAFRSGKSGSRLSPYDSKSTGGRGEPFFKHRCRYCGKVFGSDSALQIHIRSHTGERPFKCNVCGSRFTTKGNLKVHFQRHTAKFPHVKMNPNPVPEHLDKYHPPLLQQLAASGQRSLSSPPLPPPLPPPPPLPQPPSSSPTTISTSSTTTSTSSSTIIGPSGIPIPNTTNLPLQSHHPTFHPQQPPTTHGFITPQPPLPMSLAIAAAAAASGTLPSQLFHRVPLINHRTNIINDDNDQDLPENLSKTTTTATTTILSSSVSTSPSPPCHSPRSSPLSLSLQSTSLTNNNNNNLNNNSNNNNNNNSTPIHSYHHHHHHHKNNNNHNSDTIHDDVIKREQRSSPEPRPMSFTTNNDDMPITPKKEPEEAADELQDEESEELFESSSPVSRTRYLDHTTAAAAATTAAAIINHQNIINERMSLAQQQQQQQSYDDCSMDSSKISGRCIDDIDDNDDNIDEDDLDEEMDEQPENLSSRDTSKLINYHHHQQQQQQNYHNQSGCSPASSTASSGSLQTSFAGLLFPPVPTTPGQSLNSHNRSLSQNSITPGTAQQQQQIGENMMIDPARDPAIYSNLLPRPGSNDNSWESLIEITKTSETSKLQQLVDNIENKLTDPNQCIICHRVLSCKSALQMHYRTHTGERPFKCKICGRAFTTKGNLKTHMGVHRAKPPLRVLHQCPVCHKKFTNALVLQQHIRLHTGEPTDLSPEQIQAAEVNEYPPGYPPHPLASFLPGGFPGLHPGHPGFPPLGYPHSRHPLSLERHSSHDDVDMKERQQAHYNHIQHQRYFDEHSEDMMDDQDDADDDEQRDDNDVISNCDELNEKREIQDIDDDNETDKDDNNKISSSPSPSLQMQQQNFSTSLAALENQVRTITTMASAGGSISSLDRYNCNSEKSISPASSVVGTPLDLTPRASSTPGSIVSASASTPPPQQQQLPPPGASSALHHQNPFGMFAGLLQAVSSSSSSPNNNQTPNSASGGSVSGAAGGSTTPGGVNSISSMNVINPGNGSSSGGGGGSGGGGPLASLTTSSVLAASSTYNPLGLAVGGPAVRGNTTCNICYKTFACNSALEIHYRSHTKERPFKCTICDRGFSTKGNMKQHMLTHKIRDMPPHLFGDSKPPGPGTPSASQQHHDQQQHQQRDQRSQDRENSPSPMCPDESSLPPPPPPPPPLPPPSSPMTPSAILEPPMPIKRSPTEGDLPAAKRPSMSSKHLCHVCNKNFSSSSALQIHMRTHTGDKPFRCTVCQKAFTTKGNLKVHMGTHMWTNGASRRGRRMSLDLPPLPITPKDSEFLQRRPDLFYPYLPGPGFLNGVQQKLSEISVIQGNNGLPVNHPAAGKYAGLFGSLYGGGAGLNLSSNGFPMDKGPLVPSNNSLDDGKPLVPSGSMLFHTPSPSHSPGTPSSNTGNQNSASIPPWNNETLQHHFERDGPSRDNDNESTSPPAPRLPPATATRGEGLAA